MYNEASQELSFLSIHSMCQETFAFGLSLRLLFYPYSSNLYSPSHRRLKVMCFSPRPFLISVRIPFDSISLSLFSTYNWWRVHDSILVCYHSTKVELSTTHSMHHHYEAACTVVSMQNKVYMKGDGIGRGVWLCKETFNAELVCRRSIIATGLSPMLLERWLGPDKEDTLVPKWTARFTVGLVLYPQDYKIIAQAVETTVSFYIPIMILD